MATRIVVVDEIDSTQDEARNHIADTPVLVVAHRQRRGRGRTGVRWEPAPRAVACSLAWAPDWPGPLRPALTLVAGLAATDLLPARLEWPNDVVTDTGKLAGILAEQVGDHVVIGIGINLWWPDAPAGFAALHPHDPGPEAVEPLATAWAQRLLARADRGADDWGLATYRERCATLGRDITWEPHGTGRAIDVAADGALVVETTDGIRHLRSGAVRHVR